MTSRKDRVLSSDDRQVWNKVAETVKPMPRQAELETLLEILEGPPKRTEPIKMAALPLPAVHVSRPKQAVPDLDVGQMPGLDKRSAQRLVRGALSIEGRIDLHGLTRDQAQSRLLNFLAQAHERGKRNVLVITGKGSGGTGVLKTEVPRWLNLPQVREKILGFSYAQPKDGGDGALYVLIRRQRR